MWKVEEPIAKDGRHDRRFGDEVAQVSSEGRDPGAAAAMSPFGHIPNAGVRVIEEVLDPSVFGIVDGEAEGGVEGAAVIAM